MKSNLTAITIGDINGIGLELLLKIYKKNQNDYVLFTDIKVFNRYKNKNNIKIKTYVVNNNRRKQEFNKKFLNVFTYKSTSNEDKLVYANFARRRRPAEVRTTAIEYMICVELMLYLPRPPNEELRYRLRRELPLRLEPEYRERDRRSASLARRFLWRV